MYDPCLLFLSCFLQTGPRNESLFIMINYIYIISPGNIAQKELSLESIEHKNPHLLDKMTTTKSANIYEQFE